jgi:N-acetylmuramoyl-L-alanine amidase CwlA
MSYNIIQDYITPNKWSRPQKPATIEWVCVHWEAVVNARASSIRNYFENRKYGDTGYGSAHEAIDTNGDVWQLIPKDEMAYSVGSKTYTDEKYEMMGDTYPNDIVYSIEVPTINMSGYYSDVVYSAMTERVVDLLIENDLTVDKVTTHGIIVGKDCPKYFHPEWNQINNERWNRFLGDVAMKYDEKTKTLDDTHWEGAQEAWDWMTEMGYMDGNNPDGKMTRLMYAQSEYNKYMKGECE